MADSNIGSLVIYDTVGNAWLVAADVQGAVTPHTIPVGIPYIATAFGELDGKKVVGVNLETLELITEALTVPPTYVELQRQLLEALGVI